MHTLHLNCLGIQPVQSGYWTLWFGLKSSWIRYLLMCINHCRWRRKKYCLSQLDLPQYQKTTGHYLSPVRTGIDGSIQTIRCSSKQHIRIIRIHQYFPYSSPLGNIPIQTGSLRVTPHPLISKSPQNRYPTHHHHL